MQEGGGGGGTERGGGGEGRKGGTRKTPYLRMIVLGPSRGPSGDPPSGNTPAPAAAALAVLPLL